MEGSTLWKQKLMIHSHVYSWGIVAVNAMALALLFLDRIRSLGQICIWVIGIVLILDFLYGIFYARYYRAVIRMEKIIREIYPVVCLEADEERFGEILQSIENMMSDLTDKAYNKELLLVQARMSALQNQINPHFLYNTLDVIRSYAMMNDCQEVAEMTEALSTMFRYNIGKPGEMATLEEELDSVRNYFLIQRYRFGDKFQLAVQVDEDVTLEEHLIPRLSIQPLVENAIHHGLEGKMGPGTVTIKIERTERELIVRVSDDGLGMSRENVLAIRNRLALGTALYIEPRKKGKSGIAIVNLNQRLKLIFGESYGIDLASIENVGTFFTITLPIYTQHDWEQTKEESLE